MFRPDGRAKVTKILDLCYGTGRQTGKAVPNFFIKGPGRWCGEEGKRGLQKNGSEILQEKKDVLPADEDKATGRNEPPKGKNPSEGTNPRKERTHRQGKDPPKRGNGYLCFRNNVPHEETSHPKTHQ